MSTTNLEPTNGHVNGHVPPDPQLRTYRGRTLEELLPKIRAELGPDAVVVRQRDGLMGGVGGFFQQRFVEVEARRGVPRIDVYDEPPADDFAAKLLAAAREAEKEAAAPDVLAALEPPREPAAAAPPAAKAKPRKPAKPKPRARKAPAKAAAKPTPASAPAPAKPAAKPVPASAPAPAKPAAVPELAAALVAQGLTEPLAARLVADALAHELPFAADERAAVRRALARHLPLVPARRAGGLATAFVGAGGAGKTRCAAGLAAAYARAGLPVLCLALAPADGGAELAGLLSPLGVPVEPVATAAAARTRLRQAPAGALVVLDTPAVSPADPAAIARLAAQLEPLGLDEVQLVVPATLSAAAAQELQQALEPLRPSGIAVTHADATRHLGAVVELACTSRLPLAYTAAGAAGADGFAPADPVALAERLLP